MLYCLVVGVLPNYHNRTYSVALSCVLYYPTVRGGLGVDCWLPQRDAGLRVSPKAEQVSAFSGAAAAFFLTTAMARTAAAKTEKLHLNE